MNRADIKIDENEVKSVLCPQLREETKMFSSFQQILTKVETDGHLLPIYSMFNSILDSEKRFALKSCFIRDHQLEQQSLVLLP
jgi:hypothetical protein